MLKLPKNNSPSNSIPNQTTVRNTKSRWRRFGIWRFGAPGKPSGTVLASQFLMNLPSFSSLKRTSPSAPPSSLQNPSSRLIQLLFCYVGVFDPRMHLEISKRDLGDRVECARSVLWMRAGMVVRTIMWRGRGRGRGRGCGCGCGYVSEKEQRTELEKEEEEQLFLRLSCLSSEN